MTQTQLTEAEFLQAMMLLSEEDRQAVLKTFEDARQMMRESATLHQSAMTFLTITLNSKKNGEQSGSGNAHGNSNVEPNVQDTLQQSVLDSTGETL